jgi:hypothetical protein
MASTFKPNHQALNSSHQISASDNDRNNISPHPNNLPISCAR